MREDATIAIADRSGLQVVGLAYGVLTALVLVVAALLVTTADGASLDQPGIYSEPARH